MGSVVVRAGRRSDRATAVVLAALVALVAACGGGGDDDERPATDDRTEAARTLATVEPVEPGVEVVAAEGEAAAAVEAATTIGAGAVVRTAEAGFAEVTWFDGSVTRLDVATDLTVDELVDDSESSVVRARLGTGRVWSRVTELGADDEFVIDTPVGTASVAGTAFFITCTDEATCSFAVVKGVVIVELASGKVVEVTGPASFSVADGVDTEVVGMPFDAVFGDPWLAANSERDIATGFDDVEAAFEELGPAFGSLAGTFTGTRTVTAVECVTICLDELPVGDVQPRAYTFAIDCSAGAPCIGSVETEYDYEGEVVVEHRPLTFDGTSYTWSITTTGGCGWDDDGDGATDRTTGETVTTINWTMRPTAAERRGGDWVVTALEGSAGASNVVNDDGGCTSGWMGNTNDSSISVAR